MRTGKQCLVYERDQLKEKCLWRANCAYNYLYCISWLLGDEDQYWIEQTLSYHSIFTLHKKWQLLERTIKRGKKTFGDQKLKMWDNNEYIVIQFFAVSHNSSIVAIFSPLLYAIGMYQYLPMQRLYSTVRCIHLFLNNEAGSGTNKRCRDLCIELGKFHQML